LLSESLSRAVLWMLGAVVALTTMAVAGRELAAVMSIFEIMFLRNVFCLAIVVTLLLRAGPHLFKTRRAGLHVLRNTVHFGAQAGWFFGIVHLPLSEVFAIEFTAPIWTAILAAIFLSERLNTIRILGTLLGFTGVMIILRPGIAVIEPAALAVLGSAMGFGLMFVITRSMASSETPLTILFYMNLVQLPLSFALMLPDWVMPPVAFLPWVLATGLAGLASHYCFARAFALADAARVAPIDFIRLPLAALVGYLLYQEPTSVFVWLGVTVIIVGNIMNLRGDRGRP
jgi:drug/metabolite transporter (DMT)-like permease